MLRILVLCASVVAAEAFSAHFVLGKTDACSFGRRMCRQQGLGGGRCTSSLPDLRSIASRQGARGMAAQSAPSDLKETYTADEGVKSGVKVTDFDAAIPEPRQGDYLDKFCRGTNNLMRQLVIPSVRERVELQRAGAADEDIMSRLLAKPEYPPMSRPLWLVMVGSIPTALGWYGYYKFSVEEELFQEELRTEGRVTGCGGYGTLFPFVYMGLLGAVGKFALDIPNAELLLQAAGAWILGGQVNLYYRINQKFEKKGQEPPLHAWWAVLPPPFDLIVGLRQVHFLARHYAEVRGEEWQTDKVAEELFPFISSSRFTLKEFVTTPSNWFWFTKDWEDIELPPKGPF